MSDTRKLSITGDQIFGISILCVAAGLFCYDSFQWLKSGVFHSLSIRELLILADSHGPKPWLISPDRWIGVWKIIDWTPVSLVLGVFGYGLANGDLK